jgi:SAM-dependent methyltransferase
MVFKVEQGAPGIAWNRDGQMYDRAVAVTGPGRVVDVGIYLDPATPDNCVWALPGSNYWSDEKASAALASLNIDGWTIGDGVPAVMDRGDVLLHNILTLHGAPPVQGSRRRVIYFEYRPAEIEYYLGPHTHETSPYRSLMRGAELRTADIDDLNNGYPANYLLDANGRCPAPDASFDGVLSTQVLEHVPDPRAYLLEAYRMVKPGGCLVLCWVLTAGARGALHPLLRQLREAPWPGWGAAGLLLRAMRLLDRLHPGLFDRYADRHLSHLSRADSGTQTFYLVALVQAHRPMDG